MTLTATLDTDNDGAVASSFDRRVRGTFVIASALVVAFIISLVARANGSYFTPVEGWGVGAFDAEFARVSDALNSLLAAS